MLGFQGLSFIMQLATVTFALDVYLSPNFQKNFELARANGFEEKTIYFYMFTSAVIFYPAQCLVINLAFTTTIIPYFSMGLLAKVFFFLSLSKQPLPPCT